MYYKNTTYQTYKVDITNEVTKRCFDHYLIKIPNEVGQLEKIEKDIHARYPNNILKVVFTKR
jgi:hypothetical protein